MSILSKFKKSKTRINADISVPPRHIGASLAYGGDQRGYISVNPRSPRFKGEAGSYPRESALVKQVWITEKAGDMSRLRKYNFIVDKTANKPEIKKAIEQIYGVNVVSINVVNIKGKPRRMGRTMGRSSAYKKAIVTLKEGQKIDVMPT